MGQISAEDFNGFEEKGYDLKSNLSLQVDNAIVYVAESSIDHPTILTALDQQQYLKFFVNEISLIGGDYFNRMPQELRINARQEISDKFRQSIERTIPLKRPYKNVLEGINYLKSRFEPEQISKQDAINITRLIENKEHIDMFTRISLEAICTRIRLSSIAKPKKN